MNAVIPALKSYRDVEDGRIPDGAFRGERETTRV